MSAGYSRKSACSRPTRTTGRIDARCVDGSSRVCGNPANGAVRGDSDADPRVSTVPAARGKVGVTCSGVLRGGDGYGSHVAKYTLNPAAVEHAKSLIRSRQYVLDSDWGEAQLRAQAQNGFLER